ncbi:MAG: response regulator [Clostridiaceae bacterium]|nr:response regulator [Clostridiaceae bacterium]
MIRSIIIDDEKISIMVLEKMLSGYDFIDNRESCLTAYAAIEAFDKHMPDIAFVDINMPEKSGIELAKLFQSIKPDIKIVFVTADESFAVKAFELVAYDYLVKPLSHERFDLLAKRLLEQSKPGNAVVGTTLTDAISDITDTENRISIMTMGGFELKNNEGETVKWRSEKTRELFALLYHNRGRSQTKNMLIDTIWPDHDPAKAQHLLHNGIYYIRRALKEHGIDKQHILINSGYKMHLQNVFADNIYFENKIARSYIDLDTRKLESYDKLYRGPFMNFENWSWCELDRLEIEKNYDKLLQVLTDRYEAEDRQTDLEMILIRRSRRDPYNEGLAARLIIFYERSGNQQKALEYRHEFERKMQEDIWNSETMSDS